MSQMPTFLDFPHSGSVVIGCCTLALAARQWEGRLALGLRQSAGKGGKGLDQGTALGHAHLPEFHLLAPCPLLCHVWLNLTTLTQVCLVPQHNDSHLTLNKNVVIKCSALQKMSHKSCSQDVGITHSGTERKKIIIKLYTSFLSLDLSISFFRASTFLKDSKLSTL